MAAFDIVAVPSTPAYSTFGDLQLGRSSQEIVCRLIRLWTTKNIKKDGEFMGLVMLLLDEKSSVIQAFIPASIANTDSTPLREGAIVHIRNFEVANRTNMYKTTENPLTIRFLPTTTILEVPDIQLTIEREKFMLRDLQQLQTLTNTNQELPDVVGHIKMVQGPNIEDSTSTQRLVVRFQLDMSKTVNLTLWDDAAATFRAHLASDDKRSSIMVVTSVNPKIFGGNLFLNSTSATRFYFDPTIPAIHTLQNILGIVSSTDYPTTDTSSGLSKKERVTIPELQAYIAATNEGSQDADFLCKATVLGVLPNNGWSYISCSSCSRKLDKKGTGLRCNHCALSTVTGIVRYRVELAVNDGHGEAAFVVFDNEMTKLTNKTAATVTLEAVPQNVTPKQANAKMARHEYLPKKTPANCGSTTTSGETSTSTNTEASNTRKRRRE
ncbi:unnamed protein product [Cochlearia groenlandica]